jgi:hypothetical protein
MLDVILNSLFFFLVPGLARFSAVYVFVGILDDKDDILM